MKFQRNFKPKEGTIRRAVFEIVAENPQLSAEQIAGRLGMDKSAITRALQMLGFTVRQEDIHPAGDPAAHDRLLSALRVAHPSGFEDESEGPVRRWRPGPTQSLTGCTAAMAADAA